LAQAVLGSIHSGGARSWSPLLPWTGAWAHSLTASSVAFPRLAGQTHVKNRWTHPWTRSCFGIELHRRRAILVHFAAAPLGPGALAVVVGRRPSRSRGGASPLRKGRGDDIACDVRADDGMRAPWYWSSTRQGLTDFHQEVSSDYAKAMARKLIGTRLPGQDIVRVVRVEDSKLWAPFAKKRAALRSKAGAAVRTDTDGGLSTSSRTTLDASAGETYLFHGTSAAAAAKIAVENFIPSQRGCFGPGVYFSDDTRKSDGYVKDVDCKVVLLCRVLLGTVCAHDASGAHSADTITGTMNWLEFIVRDVAQIYPEYLVFYKQAQSYADVVAGRRLSEPRWGQLKEDAEVMEEELAPHGLLRAFIARWPAP